MRIGAAQIPVTTNVEDNLKNIEEKEIKGSYKSNKVPTTNRTVNSLINLKRLVTIEVVVCVSLNIFFTISEEFLFKKKSYVLNK